MNRGEFDAVLLAWQAGAVTANEALRRTRSEWSVIASHLWRRYSTRVPSWVSQEDVLQVVLLHVPRLVQKYRAMPGGSISRYVCSQAMLYAEKAIHRWRAVPGHCRNPRIEPSRCEIPSDPQVMSEVWEQLGVSGGQEEEVAVRQVFTRLMRATADVRLVVALVALRRTGGDVDMAVRILWTNPRARLCCDLRTESGAKRLVKQAMREVAMVA